MDHPVTTARLAEPGELEGRGVTAVLDRATIEETLRSEEHDQLLLNVARGTNGDVEAHIVRVDLGREDLEQILAQTDGDRVALDFDGAELEAILDADVEAHGLREKALVLTVAAATAVGAAGGASGAIPHEGGAEAPFGAVAASAGEAPATVIGGAGQPAEAPFGAVAASAGEAPATVIGGAGQPAEAPFGAVAASDGEAPATTIGGAGQPEAPFGAVAASDGEAPATTIGGAGQPEAPFGAVAASDGEAPATVIGGAGEPAAVPAAEPSTSARVAPPGAETSGAPDPAVLAGVAGGLGALAITAVAFARRREQEPRFT